MVLGFSFFCLGEDVGRFCFLMARNRLKIGI